MRAERTVKVMKFLAMEVLGAASFVVLMAMVFAGPVVWEMVW